MKHKVIAIGIALVRQAGRHGLSKTVEQPDVRKHRAACPQEVCSQGVSGFASIPPIICQAGKSLDQLLGAVRAVRQQRSGYPMAAGHPQKPLAFEATI